MRRKIPSLNALLIFEAAARLQSFTQTGEELSITQSAVCRQIASLESWLGLPLFSRVKKRVILTPAGQEYAVKIRLHLEKIERDTLELMGHKEGSGVLELATVPTFATQWLIPRLAQFKKLRPDISINISTKTSTFLFPDTLFHAAIHSGKAPWQGTVGDYLMAEDAAIPVCSPHLIGQYFESPENLSIQMIAEMPLLHLSGRLEDWRHWFELHGYPNDVSAVKGERYELFTMLIEAAIAGLGMALVPKYMVQNELDLGNLVQAVSLTLPEQTSYYLVYPEENAQYGPLHAFRAWLLSKTADI